MSLNFVERKKGSTEADRIRKLLEKDDSLVEALEVRGKTYNFEGVGPIEKLNEVLEKFRSKDTNWGITVEGIKKVGRGFRPRTVALAQARISQGLV